MEHPKQNISTCLVRASIYILTLILVLLTIMYLTYSKINHQTIEFTPISTALTNPLMGWAPWATIKKSTQPHTLIYADLTWRDFEPEQGLFDFDSFEEKNQLSRWRQDGKRVVFRFVADTPGEETHIDIPDWLFEALGEDGQFYDTEYGKGFSPNYSNPIIINSHKNAIDALGSRYGHDDFFAYIELGSLGHWGEWHVHSDIGSFPPKHIQDIYVSHYIDAFPGTYLLMRRPFAIAQNLGLGLYNDMTGDLSSTTTWLDWINNGGKFDQTGDANALVPMDNGWKKAPIGGEQAPSISDEAFYSEKLNQTLELLRMSHTTFIGPNGPYKLDKGGPLQDGIDQVLSALGYRIYVKQVQMPRWILFENNLNIQIKFANIGVAPLYYNWPANLYLFDENGVIINVFPIDMDIRKILPGESFQINTTVPVKRLKSGMYSLGIAIIDPQTKQPAVQLAMENIWQDFIYKLGSFEVIRIFDY